MADFTSMPEEDARHALGAWLVRVAKADGAYLFKEIEEIDHLLADLYGLNAVFSNGVLVMKLNGATQDTFPLPVILAKTESLREQHIRNPR